MNDHQLDLLSVNDLRELKNNIDNAIRAAIRERNKAKERPAVAIKPAPTPFDLERERDAWIAARRQSNAIAK
ncbi:MAG: hypothetical protein ABL904_24355 [Hyphomicrobiaceae bacterium]